MGDEEREPRLRGVIGVAHLGALPGDPGHRQGGFAAVLDAALADARALAEGGASAIVVENFGSAPFAKGTRDDPAPPHQVAALAIAAYEIRRASRLPVGVNCLRNDAHAALGIAAMADASFVRVNVHTGAYVTDQGLIEGDAARSTRYRAALVAASRVALFADVLVKHAAPLAALTPEQATRDALERGHADAVVVTGEATGAPVSRALLERVREAAGARPVYIGSGLDLDNAEALAPLADGAIVGTWLKEGGQVHAPVDVDRVRRLVLAARFRG